MKKSIQYSLLASQVMFIILFPLWMELTNHLHPIVLVVIWFCFSFSALFSIYFFTKETIPISGRTLHTVLFVYALSLLVLLYFRPNNQLYESINLIPLETIRFYLLGETDWLVAVYNLAANIALFIPFGIYYRYLKKSPHFFQLLWTSVALVSVIETIQFVTERGSLDIDDLLLNVFGVTIGYLLFPAVRSVFVLKK